MYGYWAAGSIDSHDEGATDHPETETPALPARALLHLLSCVPGFLHRLSPSTLRYNYPLAALPIRPLNTLLGSYTIFPRRARAS